MVTIKEIAKKAGVSIGTVDRVLHNRGMVKEKTRESILAAIEELDYKPNIAGQALAIRKKKLKLGFIIPNDTYNPFFRDIRLAAEQRAKELEQYGTQVRFFEIPVRESSKLKLDIKEIEEAALELDGLATMDVGYGALQYFIKRMHEQDKPVVYYNDLFSEDDKMLAYVGCNYIDSGRLAAGLCALAGGEDARVCVYTQSVPHEQGISSYNKRMQGFREEIKDYYPKMEILDIRPIQESRTENDRSAQEMIQLHPDVNIVYVVNPGDYEICELIHKADTKGQVRIITNDLVENQIQMMKDGIISATICQEPERQAVQTLDILFNHLAFGNVPEEKFCYTNLSIHIAQNI